MLENPFKSFMYFENLFVGMKMRAHRLLFRSWWKCFGKKEKGYSTFVFWLMNSKLWCEIIFTFCYVVWVQLVSYFNEPNNSQEGSFSSFFVLKLGYN